MRDPYDILGVPRTASQADVKSAYRKLAKKYHPDANPGHEKMFQNIAGAYHILGDEKRRKQYDAGHIDAAGNEQVRNPFGGGGGGFGRGFDPGTFYQAYEDANKKHSGDRKAGGWGFGFNAEDLFTDLFGGAKKPSASTGTRGKDREFKLSIDLKEAAQGTKKKVKLAGGTTLQVTVPAGTPEGKILRLKGKGHAGKTGQEPGDALIEIKIKAHPVFTPKGMDIYVDLPISLPEAVMGSKIKVPTISGQVAMTIPAGSNSGAVLRLKGKGLSDGKDKAGDQYVQLMIVLPEQNDKKLFEFVEKWGKEHAYDVRKNLKL